MDYQDLKFTNSEAFEMLTKYYGDSILPDLEHKMAIIKGVARTGHISLQTALNNCIALQRSQEEALRYMAAYYQYFNKLNIMKINEELKRIDYELSQYSEQTQHLETVTFLNPEAKGRLRQTYWHKCEALQKRRSELEGILNTELEATVVYPDGSEHAV